MKLPERAIQNYQFTLVMAVLLTALGLVSFLTMPRSEDPPIQGPGVAITAVFPGASPADLESLIVDPIEEVINTLEDLDQVEGIAQDGVAQVIVEFLWNVDPDDAFDEVQREVNRIRGDLPEGIVAFDMLKFSTGDVNILQVALTSETTSYRNLQNLAENLEKRFERVNGVGEAEGWAYPEQEVRIGLDLEKMRQVGVSMGQVIQAVQASSQNIPGGSIDLASRRFNIQTSGDYETLEDIGRTIVHAVGDRIIYLKDVAEVELAYQDDTYRGRFQGERAVFVTANQRVGTNIYDVRDGLEVALAEFESTLPSDVTLHVAFDQAVSVSERVNGFFSNLLQGIVLVGIVVLLALGIRASSIVVLAIPVSILIAIGWLDLNNYGIEQMSIVGLVVALGLLVDNAIVVTENVNRFMRKGMSGMQAAVAGTGEVGWAIIAATVTTVLAFLPMVLIQGDSGNYIRSLPLTVIFALIASLVISLTVTPLLSSWLLRKEPKRTPILQRWLNKAVDGPYERLLNTVLRRPVVTLSVAAFTLVLSFVLFPFIGVSLFPKAEKPQFIVNVETPEGSTLDFTDGMMMEVESILDDHEGIKLHVANVGRDNPRFYYNVIPRRERSNIGQLLVELHDARDIRDVSDDLKEAFAQIPGADIDIFELENGPPIDAPIAIRVIGPELETLDVLAAEVQQIIATTPGTENIDNPMSKPKTDLRVHINRDKAGLLGVPLVEVDRTIRASMAGLPVASYRDPSGEEHDVVMRLPLDDRPTMSDFDRISVSSVTGAGIPLRQIADVQFEAVPTRIEHYNLERTVMVTGWVQNGFGEFDVIADVVDQLERYDWPPEYRFVVAGKLEAQEESFGGMASALVVAILGIIGVLVLQFRSFSQPFIIIVAIPLAIIGSVLALLITGYTFSFSAFVGLTSLVGIVVNNAIILVDYANKQVESGASVVDAVMQSSKTRFNPIVLTSLTTIGGLLPLTLSNSTMWSPMGWVIIGGLVASTVLTLVVVPVLYKLLTRVEVTT